MDIELLPRNSTSNTQYNQVQHPLRLSDIEDHIVENLLNLTSQSNIGLPIQLGAFRKWQSLLYIHPFSRRSIAWNLIVMLIIYILELQISLALGFGPDFVNAEINNTSYFMAFYYSMLVVLMIDVFFNFHKGYYAFGQGKVLDEPKDIVIEYLKFQFWVDLICIGIMIIIVPTNGFFINFLQLIPLCLLWIKKFHYQEEVTQFLQYRKSARISFILTVLGIDVIMIANFGACIFVGLDLLLWQLQYYGNNSSYYWLSNDSEYSVDLIGGPWGLQYTYAQSFSTGTLSTLAPGPFGKNPIEIFYAILVMTFFMILASYVGEVLVSILYIDEQKRVFHESNIQKFDQFMTLKQVSRQIKARIHNFFQLIWQIEVKMDTKVKEHVINKLPATLKEKLLSEISFAKYIQILKHLPNNSMLEKLINNKITQVVLDSQTCIYLSGGEGLENNTHSIYYIKEGMARFYLANRQQHSKQHLLALSNMERLLGSYEFLTGQAYQCCCKVIDLCTVDRLTFTDFIEIITISKLLQQFYMIKEQVLIERKFNIISKVCVVCMQQHRQTECTELFGKYAAWEYLRDTGFTYSHRRERQSKSKRKSYSKIKKLIGVGIHTTQLEKQFINQDQKQLNPPKSIFNVFEKYSAIERAISIFNKQDSIDVVKQFEVYRPSYNLQGRKKLII